MSASTLPTRDRKEERIMIHDLNPQEDRNPCTRLKGTTRSLIL